MLTAKQLTDITEDEIRETRRLQRIARTAHLNCYEREVWHLNRDDGWGDPSEEDEQREYSERLARHTEYTSTLSRCYEDYFDTDGNPLPFTQPEYTDWP